MYNEEFKMQYLKDDSSNKSLLNFMPTLFENIGKFEEEYKKDLCNFNIEEIENFFTALSTSSINRCLNIRSQFIKYCVYCEARNMIDDHQIHWEEADRQFISNCINYGKRIEELVTRDDLLQALNHLANGRDKFIPLAIFEGICGNRYKDFKTLTLKDFIARKNKYIVNINGNKKEVSKQLYYYAEEAANSYVIYSERFPNGRKVFEEYDNRVVKMNKNSRLDYHYEELAYLHKISNILSSIKNKTGKGFITQSALVNSGRLYYIYINQPKDTDVYTYISQNRDKLTNLFGRIQSIEGIVEQFNILYGGGEK